jgi:2,4'-dihydroxyacetophenone dioxygenase
MPAEYREQRRRRVSGECREVLIPALADEGFEKVNKVPGELSKLLWSRARERGIDDVKDDASMHMVRFTKGAGIPTRHSHACNQFMYCISGAYLYKSSGLVLRAGDFYFNPKGCEHGPTEALEDTVLLEIYDGPHWAEKPYFEYQAGEKRA